jgi:hypothetical protein
MPKYVENNTERHKPNTQKPSFKDADNNLEVGEPETS